MVRAPRGDKVVDGGIYGSRLVSDLVVGKYWDSLPLHRQGQQLERLGLSMPSSSMADQIRWATELLEPVWLFLMKQVLLSTVMHVDATSLPVKDKDAVGGITLGSLWGYVGDESAAVYLYTRTGKKVGQVEGEIGPHDFLAMRKGFVVADAAGIFDESFTRPDLIEIGCNMHARRYFVKALEANDARAAIPIKAFKTLYDVEDDVRGADSDRPVRGEDASVEAGLRRAHRLVQDVSTRGATELSARPRDGLPPEPSDGPDAIPRRRTVADRQRDRGASASSACSGEAQLPLCGLPHGRAARRSRTRSCRRAICSASTRPSTSRTSFRGCLAGSRSRATSRRSRRRRGRRRGIGCARATRRRPRSPPATTDAVRPSTADRANTGMRSGG